MSPVPITLHELSYNQFNWRDVLTNKEKSLTRSEHEEYLKDSKQLAIEKYTIAKSKKNVRRYNDIYRDGRSEVVQMHHYENATQIHHIFPLSDFPEIGHYLENLIALTPTQHYSYAHPNNNTQYIDKDYQYICLLSKTCTIMENIYSPEENDIYDFSSYITVLNTGLETTIFEEVKEYDFKKLVERIDYIYSDYIENSKYIYEKSENYPLF